MITITFPDREAEKRALGFLLGRFSGRVLKTGEHLVPEAALEALANQNIPFNVEGKSAFEQQTSSLRGVSLKFDRGSGISSDKLSEAVLEIAETVGAASYLT